MSLVATLIAKPQSGAIDDRLLEAAVEGTGGRTSILHENHAVDIALPDVAIRAEAEAALRDVVADRPVDVVVQRAEGRRKSVLLADMDSTMIRQECIDELADYVGVKDRVATITARAMNGEIAFEPALRERVALLKGLPVAVISEVIRDRIQLMDGGPELVATMRANGAWCALVSGGFTSFTAPIADRLGFDENRANRLLERDGALTGEVAEPILGRQAKVDALCDITAARGLRPDDVICVGDGANDLGMIELAGTGVALHAKPAVAARAGCRIDHGDLTALLFIQGYRRADFHS